MSNDIEIEYQTGEQISFIMMKGREVNPNNIRNAVWCACTLIPDVDYATLYERVRRRFYSNESSDVHATTENAPTEQFYGNEKT